jgi:hypothetical protein
LLDEMAHSGVILKLPAGSRVMETGGYKGRTREMLKEELHTCLNARLGISYEFIVCEYGMCELSSQAYDRIAGNRSSVSVPPRIFRFPPWARVQIISPESGREVGDGETGLIRVFDLANLVSAPVVQTEDLAIRRGEGFEFIGRATEAEPRGCSMRSL